MRNEFSLEGAARIPLPFDSESASAMPSGPRSPQDVLSCVKVASHELQGFRPIAESIEWDLGHLHWARAGLLAFAENEVPFVVNNSGRLSEDAAALLFNHCVSTEPAGPIHVLELGAGCGLFARYFLQAFNQLCQQEGRAFDRQLVYFVTDASERTLAQWRERRMFDAFGAQVVMARCDATRPTEIRLADGRVQSLQALQAVFCNYVLDVLPATVLRRQGERIEELRVRTRLTDNADLVRQYTPLGLEEIRALANAHDPDQRALLLPLAGLFDYEVDFFPLEGELPLFAGQALERADPVPKLLVNHGAFGALHTLQGQLVDGGFILINDYGASTPQAAAESAAPQRFGKTSAIGLNFPLLGQLFDRDGWRVVVPEGDATRAIHARLLVKAEQERTIAAFGNRFCADAQQFFDGPAQDARGHLQAGRQDAALESYRLAIARNPRDWRLLGEVAEFVGIQLRDFAAGIELARSALDINPWLSAWLWNVLGDCLYCLERHGEAQEAYFQAQRIDPKDARTQLNLAYAWQQRADFEKALGAVARGLAGDVHGIHGPRLLEKQQQILAQMASLRATEMQRSAERAARLQAA